MTCYATQQLNNHQRNQDAKERDESEAERRSEATHSLLDLIVEASGDAVLIAAIERLSDKIGIALHELHMENITTAQGVDADFDDYLEAM
ncbi:hypothetical protein [uncultured Endozoicomonas sp.]|uniref:hypothetical protein n=1 Tax=uncultured Endozoicomonas sp. TaxID=432652 RepID=UPI00262CAFF5|nr:hypothetical protein [uncultured Endozoicomonas sp.]